MAIDTLGTEDASPKQWEGAVRGDQERTEEQELWRRFAEAGSAKGFYESWLALQCRMFRGTRCALLLLGPPDTGPFTPAAVFPSPLHDVTHLAGPAERSLKERRGMLIKAESDHGGQGSNVYYLTYPIDLSGKIHGVAVLELENIPLHEVQMVMRQLHWGAAWLEVLVRRGEIQQSRETHERVKRVLDAVAVTVEQKQFQAVAMGFVTGLATTFSCDRVSAGFVKRGRLRVEALSHSAEFGKRTNLLRSIENAMDEAVDQHTVVIYPWPSGAVPLVTRAHEDLAHDQGSGAICTVPFGQEKDPSGALTFERPADRPFDPSTVEAIKTIAALAGPVLEMERREERLISTKVAEALVKQLRKLTGPEHFGVKLATATVVVAIIFFTFFKCTHIVRAPTVLEGVVQRAVGAPFNGYVTEAPARPGDVVRQGDVLCLLDDRDLKLERLRWATQSQQFSKQFAEAMAKHDRAQVLINQAKMDQADAQVSLLDEQLSRTKIVAPFDGIVTSGDFSQSLGTPVERGQTLFEVAPLRGYRVILQVDERDIGWVAFAQKGELALPSIPGQVFPLTITRITPISTAKEGRNYFRVEAELKKTSERLRPGMEGVGKIEAGKARLIWVWTHEVFEWITLKLWKWWP